MGLVSLYETMFRQYDVTTSLILVTEKDFLHAATKQNVNRVLNDMMSLGIVPVRSARLFTMSRLFSFTFLSVRRVRVLNDIMSLGIVPGRSACVF
jgi:hypothetical protein